MGPCNHRCRGGRPRRARQCRDWGVRRGARSWRLQGCTSFPRRDPLLIGARRKSEAACFGHGAPFVRLIRLFRPPLLFGSARKISGEWKRCGSLLWRERRAGSTEARTPGADYSETPDPSTASRDCARDCAREQPNPPSFQPTLAKRERENPSVSCELTEGIVGAGRAYETPALPPELRRRVGGPSSKRTGLRDRRQVT